MEQAVEHLDLLIEARWVIPVEPANTMLEHHAVAIRGEHIVAVLPISEARLRYSATQTVSLPDHALIPGLINLHTHAAMSLLRGIADDLPLMRWLNESIWPIERKHVSERFVFDGTLLGGAEMLRGGVTCASDMYFYPDASARAYEQLGMRAVVGMTVIDFPTGYASDAEDYLSKGLQVRDNWLDHPRIGFSLAPHAPYTVSDDTWERIGSLAQELDILIHTHVHETASEISQSIEKYGVRPMQRLHSLGLLGPNLLIAHAVHVTPDEIGMLASNNVGVAHNPTSNMKLASGAAPIADMIAAGIRVGLGSDGAASNNRLDIFQEMRMASLLAKLSSGNASVLPAYKALRMATIDAAYALGMQDSLGSLSVGKKADMTAVALDSLETSPVFDPVSHLVYVAGREHVSDVWVGGRALIQNKVLLHNDNKELLRISRLWQNSLQN
ncbi:MAG: N-ethylammeline chlorohydrolase [Rhodocyclales bacterium]|nr:N-ethylammeline chlorohydrolase [Rhodocyclales bacterium]